jgi:hypothetical protein
MSKSQERPPIANFNVPEWPAPNILYMDSENVLRYHCTRRRAVCLKKYPDVCPPNYYHNTPFSEDAWEINPTLVSSVKPLSKTVHMRCLRKSTGRISSGRAATSVTDAYINDSTRAEIIPERRGLQNSANMLRSCINKETMHLPKDKRSQLKWRKR